MNEPRIFVASHTDGSQTLVTLYDDTTGEVARRRRPTDTWGVPTSLRAQVSTVSAEPVDPEDRLSKVAIHTRASTPVGPDFCQDCSDAIGDWVKWPCKGSIYGRASGALRAEVAR